jgi:hypothetical protein
LKDEEEMKISQQHKVPILQALSAIFELSPLSLKAKSLNELEDFVKIFKNLGSSAAEEEQDPLEDAPNPFLFCSGCGELLAVLFNAFQAFLKILKTDGELANKFKELQNLRENNLAEIIKVDEEEEPLPKRKRGRPKKNLKEEPPAVKIKRTRKKKAKVLLPQILSDSDDEELAVKEEMSSDHELSDVEFTGVGVEEYKDESSSSPPDSPISMSKYIGETHEVI